MSFASYFTSAFKPPFRLDDHLSSRKRKRGSVSSDEESTASEIDAHSNSRRPGSSVGGSITPSFSSTPFTATIRRELAVQYHATGQVFDDELPGNKFPHAPSSRMAIMPLVDSKTAIRDELATLKPPLTRTKLPDPKGSNASEESIGLRQRHLDNITAVLYRCVLDGDFLRAGRAWGMLLRAEKSGRGVDIRRTDRWGLGAEILLKRARDGEEKASGNAESFAQDQSTENPRQWFSKEGFENAKDYYERLIIQYPYRKAYPTTTSALEFYPPMFGLWLYAVQEQHKSAMTTIEKATSECADSSTEERKNASPSQEQVAADIRNFTLQRGNEIASRLDELLVSPPYSDDSTLWRLRGMVALWIADLWVFAMPSPADTEFSDGESSATSELTSPGASRRHPQVLSEHKQYRVNRQVAISKAEQAFRKAAEKGLHDEFRHSTSQSKKSHTDKSREALDRLWTMSERWNWRDKARGLS